jgi:hypothetical protein
MRGQISLEITGLKDILDVQEFDSDALLSGVLEGRDQGSRVVPRREGLPLQIGPLGHPTAPTRTRPFVVWSPDEPGMARSKPPGPTSVLIYWGFYL